VNLTAIISPVPASGTVTFKDGSIVLGSAAASGGVGTLHASALAVGVHSLTASFSAGGISAPLSQTVTRANTASTLSGSPNPSVFGQAVTFTATMSAVAPGAGMPTGSVRFQDGATVLGTVALVGGHASLSTSVLTVTTHTIYATYLGSTSFNPSRAGMHQVVNRAATTTGAVGSPNPATHGTVVTFTATVHVVAPGTGVPTGSVTFKDGATILGTRALSGAGMASVSTSSLAPGAHSITASYAGDAHFNVSMGSVSEKIS
jgi:hypothetical protein